jgi:hypothetical protein
MEWQREYEIGKFHNQRCFREFDHSLSHELIDSNPNFLNIDSHSIDSAHPTKQLNKILMKGCIHTFLALFCLSTTQAQLQVASGETVKVASADEVRSFEDLQNNGTVERITLAGTSAQTVTGTGIIEHLKLNKSSNTATISSGMQSVTGTLDLAAGTLTSDGRLTLKSSSAGTAQVVQHTTAGTVDRNVVVERHIPGSRKKQWRVLAFPFSNAITLNQISGIGITTSAGTQSMMLFNESDDNGVYGNGTVRNAGYQSFSNLNDLIPTGKGVAAWLYGPDNNSHLTLGDLSSDLVISSFGQLNESGSNVVLTTPTITNNQQGWNLVANPFASPIDWHAVLTASTSGNIASTVYRWDPQASDWTAYNQSGGTTGVGSQYIESGSAFFITSATKKPTGGDMTLTIPQSAKVSITENTANKHFVRAPFRLDLPQERVNSTFVKLVGIRVKASGVGNPIPGEAYLDVSREDATRGWDPKYDGLMLPRSSGASVYFEGDRDDDFCMQFDAVLPAGDKRYYPITVTSPGPGQTTLELRPEGAWNPLNSVSLIDINEGKTYLMRGDLLKHTFQMPSQKEESRFLLAINHVAVDRDGGVPGKELRLLGNPVTGERIDLLLAHPTARPKKWELSSMNGAKVAEGRFDLTEGNVQYGLQAPGMRAAGSYVLRVELDNGEVQTVQVMRK